MISESVLAGFEVVNHDSDRALDLHDTDAVWYVEKGAVDVFAVGFQDEDVATAYRHVARFEQGSLLFGIAPLTPAVLRFRTKPLYGFAARRVPLEQLRRHVASERLAVGIDEWIELITNAVIQELETIPMPDRRIDASESIESQVGNTIAAKRGVVWVSINASHSYLGTISSSAAFIPLTRQSWISCSAEGTLEAITTEELIERGFLDANLQEFQRVALEAIQETRALALLDLAMLQSERSTLRHTEETKARVALQHLATGKTGVFDNDSRLVSALTTIGQHEGIEFRTPLRRQDQSESLALFEVLLASGVNAREVHLPEGEEWWRGDKGALLASKKGDKTPVALIPSTFGRYQAYDAESDKKTKMTREIAEGLDSRAWSLYAPFPSRKVSLRDVVRMVATGATPHLLHYGIAGLVVALISFTPALLIGVITDIVAPRHDLILLQIATTMIVFAALISGMTHLTQSIAMLRVEARGEVRATAAIWDRVFRIRPQDRQDYMAGDLATRTMSFERLRNSVSGTLANVLSSVLFLLPAIALLFFFGPLLAMVVVGIGVVFVGVLLVLGSIQLKWQSQVVEIRQRLNGSLYEFVNAMSRIQKAGATGSVFAAWAKPYCEMKTAELNSNLLTALITALSLSSPFLASAILLALYALIPASNMTLGEFLTIYAAAFVFFTAVTRLGSSVSDLTEVLPTYKQTTPLLHATTEQDGASEAQRIFPRQLTGEVQVDHVSYRYEKDGPLILDDVSVHCSPGEFVAIVGASGSGKSTLLKLMLGLEQPESGAVYYDRQNLTGFNLDAIRQQIGVVTQRSSLIPGSILQNIVGINNNLTIDDAWRAAEMAALSDDIQNMPMGMYTPVGDDESLFSGGQSQKMLIASALVTRPRLLFLDEATNWLDNASQAQVVASIERVAATRLVIAHRLATIRKADRIYVMHAGRVVQVGAFDELSATEGLFKELVKRQVIEPDAIAPQAG